MSTKRLFYGMGLLAIMGLVPSFAFGQTAGIHWRSSLDAAKAEASQTGRLVLLHFWSPSCGPCRKLESTVFSVPQVGTAIEKNYVPVKINAAASSAMVYAFKVDRVPRDYILTSNGNVLATYTSPSTPEGYLAKLNEVVAQFGQPGSKPVDKAELRQVNPAYAALQNSPTLTTSTQPLQTTSTPVANSIARVSANAMTPATNRPASQPSQPVDRYALPARKYSNPQKPAVPVNAMPSSYRNPYMAARMQSSTSQAALAPAAAAPAAAAAAAAAYPSQSSATANTVPPAVASNAAKQTMATAKVSAKATKKPSGIVQLPAGSPPLGFEGYCPVTLKFDKKWVRGNVQFGAIHRGRTYLFVGDQQRQQFLANPDAYSPVFSGMDPVALLDNGQTVAGNRKYGFEYRGAFYLFSSQETMKKFSSQPDHYAAEVRQAMVQHDGGAGVIRR